jgi:archaellum biogenesis protein FlaJ (TadC family)
MLTKKALKQKEALTELKLKRWEREKKIAEKLLQIKQEKKELRQKFFNINFNFSKVFAFLLFINFTVIEIFTGWTTIQSFNLAYAIGMMPDFTPLITLIGAIIGQTLSYGIYANKAKAENTKDGIKFEAVMQQFNDCEEDIIYPPTDDSVG